MVQIGGDVLVGRGQFGGGFKGCFGFAIPVETQFAPAFEVIGIGGVGVVFNQFFADLQPFAVLPGLKTRFSERVGDLPIERGFFTLRLEQTDGLGKIPFQAMDLSFLKAHCNGVFGLQILFHCGERHVVLSLEIEQIHIFSEVAIIAVALGE